MGALLTGRLFFHHDCQKSVYPAVSYNRQSSVSDVAHQLLHRVGILTPGEGEHHENIPPSHQPRCHHRDGTRYSNVFSFART